MHLSAVSIHPLKSCRAIDVEEAFVERSGLRGDRQWMVVGTIRGKPVTARNAPGLLLVTATPTADGGLVLAAPGATPMTVPPVSTDPGAAREVAGMGRVLPAGEQADAWLSEVLGRGLRLVRLDPATPRVLAAKHGGEPGDSHGLSDAGPLLLTTRASLEQLQRWVDERAVEDEQPRTELTMARFRPNLVVDGAPGEVEAFVEDGWERIAVGETVLRFGELCDRCVMTTIQPESLDRGKEPIRTLARHRRLAGGVMFGVRLIPTTTGPVHVGDEVRVLARR